MSTGPPRRITPILRCSELYARLQGQNSRAAIVCRTTNFAACIMHDLQRVMSMGFSSSQILEQLENYGTDAERINIRNQLDEIEAQAQRSDDSDIEITGTGRGGFQNNRNGGNINPPPNNQGRRPGNGVHAYFYVGQDQFCISSGGVVTFIPGGNPHNDTFVRLSNDGTPMVEGFDSRGNSLGWFNLPNPRTHTQGQANVVARFGPYHIIANSGVALPPGSLQNRPEYQALSHSERTRILAIRDRDNSNLTSADRATILRWERTRRTNPGNESLDAFMRNQIGRARTGNFYACAREFCYREMLRTCRLFSQGTCRDLTRLCNPTIGCHNDTFNPDAQDPFLGYRD